MTQEHGGGGWNCMSENSRLYFAVKLVMATALSQKLRCLAPGMQPGDAKLAAIEWTVTLVITAATLIGILCLRSRGEPDGKAMGRSTIGAMVEMCR